VAATGGTASSPVQDRELNKPLDPDRWARVEALFEEALARPEAQRAAFLAESCGDDLDLLREVKHLVAAAGPGITERLERVDRFVDDLRAATAHTAVGQRLGAYVLEEEIGRGGMGVVYRAARADGDFDQTVAVKVLAGALFSPDAIARFRNERRILAGLEHPNIARLLDGGSTPDGVPYVIMEYADGVPVDRFADEEGLELEARVWLFLAICEAVHYAHRNLVVHRDLKPSNILVTGDGAPKLLDFGIAKLMEPQDAPPALLPTATRLMTPGFASPEQLLGERIGIATDVYSLGLLLYRLLAGVDARAAARRGGSGTGGSAVGEADVSPSSPSHAELIRWVMEEEPVPPSVAAADPALRGDLDTIVLEALRRDPDERYESVRALADDLERYLTGKPIRARPPTLGYRARKFFRRNRTPLLAVAASVVLMVTQTGVFMGRLAEERDLARQEAARATQTLGFLTDVFRGADPFVSAGTDLSAAELLAHGTARLEEQLAAQPTVQAEILDAVGTVYENLGALDSARAVLERSLAVREATFGPDAPETALGLSRLGGALLRLDDVDRADSLLLRSLAIRQAKLPGNHADIAAVLGQRAHLANRAGDPAAADSLYAAAVAIMEDPVEPRDPLRATLLSNRGVLLTKLDRLEEAQTALQSALALRRGLYGDRHPAVAVTLNHLARVRHYAGDLHESEALFRELLAWAPDVLGDEHSFVTTWHGNLSAVLKDLGRNEEALEIQEHVLEQRRRQHGELSGEMAVALNNIGNLYGNLGRFEEAEAALQKGLDIDRALYGDDTPTVATSLNNLANLVWRRGDHARAAALQERVLDMDRRHLGPTHEYVATDLTALGQYYLYAGRLEQAVDRLREGYELIREVRGLDNANTANAAAGYADALVAIGRSDPAEALARQSLETRLSMFGEDHYNVALSRSSLGAALALRGDLAAAEAELTRARDVMAGSVPERDPTRLRNEERLAALYRALGRTSPSTQP
jgi:eukaryotic-like serine/threonine-protein kinase